MQRDDVVNPSVSVDQDLRKAAPASTPCAWPYGAYGAYGAYCQRRHARRNQLDGRGALAAATLAFTAAYLLSRRLWLPMGTNFAWNYLFSAVFSVPVWAVASTLLLRRAHADGQFRPRLPATPSAGQAGQRGR